MGIKKSADFQDWSVASVVPAWTYPQGMMPSSFGCHTEFLGTLAKAEKRFHIMKKKRYKSTKMVKSHKRQNYSNLHSIRPAADCGLYLCLVCTAINLANFHALSIIMMFFPRLNVPLCINETKMAHNFKLAVYLYSLMRFSDLSLKYEAPAAKTRVRKNEKKTPKIPLRWLRVI